MVGSGLGIWGENDSNQVTALYLNGGDGSFTSGGFIEVFSAINAFLVDLDGDGDLDVLHSKHNAPCAVHLNDGSGVFTIAADSTLAVQFPSWYYNFADVDGDGDLDLLNGNMLMINVGNGRFSRDRASPLASSPSLMSSWFADLDDGDTAASPTLTRLDVCACVPYATCPWDQT